ncbi:MAG: uncharacterized protein JWP87_1868 [Labilithrix sp.]|nr:uncharacterized protein [Labilithrix sp.]
MSMLRTGIMCGVAALIASSNASAAPRQKTASSPKPPNQCAAAYKTAQEREEAGRLLAARALAVSCAKVSCGMTLMEQCAAMHAQIESDLPSFLPVVTDAAGAPRADVEVRVDGELVASRLEGRPLAIDPGAHDVTFTTNGGSSHDQKFALVTTVKVNIDARDRGRQIAITLPTSRENVTAQAATPTEIGEKPAVVDVPPPADGAKQGRSVFPYVLGGAGIVALGAGALLTLWGRDDNRRLAQCSPNCSQGSIDHIQTMYIAADVSLGVGVVALGLATVLLATRSSEAKPPARAAYVVDVKPAPNGAFTTLSGSF